MCLCWSVTWAVWHHLLLTPGASSVMKLLYTCWRAPEHLLDYGLIDYIVYHESIGSQGMMGDPGPKGFPQEIDVPYTGMDMSTLIISTMTINHQILSLWDVITVMWRHQPFMMLPPVMMSPNCSRWSWRPRLPWTEWPCRRHGGDGNAWSPRSHRLLHTW